MRDAARAASRHSRECEPSQNGLFALVPHAHQTTVQGLSNWTLSGVNSVPRCVPSQ